jgi:ABC-2 type transport system permease protein
MDKYLQVFKISFQQEFAYRINFVMWRVRNIFQIFLVFFLWDSVFSNPTREIFGYNKEKILTYVFGLLIVRAFVLSSRAQDVAGEISRGEIINYFLKPVDYFKYWLTRDLSSKVLNICFATFEAGILYMILKPPFFIQTNFVSLLAFLISIVIAILIFFYLLFLVDSITFWVPEAGWGAQFLVTVVAVEYLSGAIFPIDILPESFQNFLNLTPFPYMIYFPLQVYLGHIAGATLIRGILVAAIWLIILMVLFRYVWKKGITAYQAYGR